MSYTVYTSLVVLKQRWQVWSVGILWVMDTGGTPSEMEGTLNLQVTEN